MGNVTSTLTMKLIDGVTGIAGKVGASIAKLDAASRKAAGTKTAGLGRTEAILAGGGAAFATAVGAYAVANTAKEAYTRFADFDRRITRIRQTADASVAEGERAKAQIRQTADATGLSVNEIVEGVEALVASGRSLPESMQFVTAISKAAQASGAGVGDIAKTADAIGSSMKIAGREMQTAFDILVTQGKAGKFELKDMAQYLPSLAPAAAAIGLKGTEGLNKLAATLQVIRNQTGSAGEAATAMANVFQKMETEETAKKFSKFGIDLRKEMAKARKEGKALDEVFYDLSERALKGDLSKLPQLFADAQFAQGMRAILSQRELLRQFTANITKAGGAVERDLVAPANDAASAIQRLSNAWDGALKAFGAAADAGGVTTLLKTLTEGFNAVNREAVETGKNFEELGKIMTSLRDMKFGDAAQKTAEFLGGVTDDTRRAEARRAAVGIGQAMEAQYESTRKALAERERLDKIMAKYPKGQVPSVIQAQSDAVDTTLSTARSRADAVVKELGAKLTDAIVQSLPFNPLKGSPDLPSPELSRPRLGPGQLPFPTPKPSGLDFAPVNDPVAELPAKIKQSGDEAVAEAERVAARIKAAFDAVQPVITPTVNMPNISSYALGKRVSDGVNGAQSDTGGRR
jgi:TP901 family phage tail tape measure protein